MKRRPPSRRNLQPIRAISVFQAASKAEFKRFVMMAMGSADEMRIWCRYCLDLGYIDEAIWQAWRQEYREIAKMLQVLYRKIGPAPSDI